MDIRSRLKGLQHIGIPTTDMGKSISFYERLGFQTVYEKLLEGSGRRIVFLKMENLVLEAYEESATAGCEGAIAHFAIAVDGIDEVFADLKNNGYELLTQEIQYLPIGEKGCRYFMIQGPNMEKIEFNE